MTRKVDSKINIDEILRKSFIFENIVKKLNKFSSIIDLTKKIEEKKQIKDQEDLKNKFLETDISNQNELVPNINDIEKQKQKNFLKEVNEKSDIWMHGFSSVRKDNSGFYILKSDNPSGKNMKIGDLISDYSMNLSPYWEIEQINGDRINLKPIGSNPFKTGIGAGGAKLTEQDLEVFSGGYESKRLDHIKKKIQEGTANIDDIKYGLLGTVGVRFGPNGAEGGWYNCEDTSCRGRLKGMNPKQIMIADAEMLKKINIPVPKKALDGTLNPHDWSSWVEQPDHRIEYSPTDIKKYLDFDRRMVEKGRYKNISSFDSEERKYDKDKLEKYYEDLIKDLIILDFENFKKKHENFKYFNNLSVEDLNRLYEKDLKALEARKAEQDKFITEHEDDSIESIVRNACSTEPRISMRNILLLIEKSKEDNSLIKYLKSIILNGGGYWLGNEKIINYFDLIDDEEGLKLAAENLKDPTNKRYALNYLINRDEQYVLNKINTIKSMEVLKSIINNLKNKERGDGNYYGRAPNTLKLIKEKRIISQLDAIINNWINECKISGKYIFSEEAYHANELLSEILSMFGSTYDWADEDKLLVDKLKDLKRKYESVK